jgi:formylglycine-generating enzyme
MRFALFLTTLVACAADARAVTIAWSLVGNPGNAADTVVVLEDGTTGYGAVGYNYKIGTYDVTNSQYVEFLNVKVPSGTGALRLRLFNPDMAAPGFGAMRYDPAAPAGEHFSVLRGLENQPVNNVNWYEAIRFANWMSNGQGNGDTETGSYTLGPLDARGVPLDGDSIRRNSTATVVLPNENEWYKAAYYNPASHSYFKYPTSSDSRPSATNPPSTVANSANYNLFSSIPYLTDVGAYTATTSPYGAFDMAGNVWQWTGDLVKLFGNFYRGQRGGAYDWTDYYFASSSRGGNVPLDTSYMDSGFRLALVPEPSSFVLAVLGLISCLAFAGQRGRPGTTLTGANCSPLRGNC